MPKRSNWSNVRRRDVMQRQGHESVKDGDDTQGAKWLTKPTNVRRGIKGVFRKGFGELKRTVALLGLAGYWKSDGNRQVFHARKGVVINWWPSTGTIQFQGPWQKAQNLEIRLLQLLCAKAA
jgi:hypothetical protein